MKMTGAADNTQQLDKSNSSCCCPFVSRTNTTFINHDRNAITTTTTTSSGRGTVGTERKRCGRSSAGARARDVHVCPPGTRGRPGAHLRHRRGRGHQDGGRGSEGMWTEFPPRPS